MIDISYIQGRLVLAKFWLAVSDKDDVLSADQLNELAAAKVAREVADERRAQRKQGMKYPTARHAHGPTKENVTASLVAMVGAMHSACPTSAVRRHLLRQRDPRDHD